MCRFKFLERDIDFIIIKGQSHFQAWNKKEAARKEKKEEKVIIKPHCELFLTNLPPQMRSIAGLAGLNFRPKYSSQTY